MNNVVTLAYNDVVNHELNPFKGQIFNTRDHTNVYPGDDKIDYQGKDANAENFLRVISGDDRHGRAIHSTKNDDLFIYYDDHGAPGLLCVPSNNGPEIYADQIRKVLEDLKAQKKFRNIFFVIEACYSGSVAYNMSIPGVFVLAAAAPFQSSFSADWDDDLNTFRTNEFTKNFVHYLLGHPDGRIIDYVNYAANKTIRSHVSAYGDFDVSKRKISDFINTAIPVNVEEEEEYDDEEEANGGYEIKSKNIFVEFLKRRLNHTTGDAHERVKKALESEQKRRKLASSTFKTIARHVDPNGGEYGDLDTNSIEYDCYRAAVEGFRLFCGEVDEHELPKLKVFGHLCKVTSTRTLLNQIRETCPQKLWAPDVLYV